MVNGEKLNKSDLSFVLLKPHISTCISIRCKHTNFEDATHAPMMVHIPGRTDGGITTEALTEFVDLFPTLVDAANLPPLELCPEDSDKTMLCREGSSLMPLIDDPKLPNWKNRVFSQCKRDGGYMGYTMRTDKYRYTEWVQFKYAPEYKPNWNNLTATELYDHEADLVRISTHVILLYSILLSP
jgi:iduronate 2-sulfatase